MLTKRSLLWANLVAFILVPFFIGAVLQFEQPDWFWGPVLFLLIAVECALLVTPFAIICEYDK